jgi:DNA replication and repair protein RecF
MLTGIELAGFRNYPRLSVSFDRRVNLFIGANGQGKTNLLEGVFFLAYLRSFRTSSLRDLCGAGESAFRIAGEIRGEPPHGWTRRLGVVYGEKRQLRVDDNPVRTAGEFIGQFRVVAFAPDDLRLIQGAAPLRRRFLDMVLATVDAAHLHVLQEYAAALKARNAALRNSQADVQRAAAAFEPILARTGSAVVAARKILIAALETFMADRIGRILGRSVSFQLRHQTQARTDDPDHVRERLAADRDRDRERGYTGYGPHLDDLVFLLDGHDLRHHGSTGQCRLAALSLKMAVIQWYRELVDNPRDLVVLVDDVTGELDAPTRDAFLADLQAADQLMVTFTAPPADASLFPDAARFNVCAGSVSAE